MTAMDSADISIVTDRSVAIITFDRPKALNALTRAMRLALLEAFPKFARDPMIYAVVQRSAAPRAFSAGSDVREIIALAKSDLADARKAFREEYMLNWQIECFSKPTVSLINGMVMGGGVGVSAFGTHRVAGVSYRWAMPETKLGLFPDVGAAFTLSRMPDWIGMYLGLTGREIGRADAYALKLVTHCIAPSAFDDIPAGLADVWPVDPILDERHADPGEAPLEPYRATIAKCFSAPTVEGIVERLEAIEDDSREWAGTVVQELRLRSPLSLKVTHRHIRNAAALDVRQTLMADFRLACRFLESHDFHEGARALLIDKDGAPNWRPARIEDVTQAMLDDYFAPLGADELILPTREEMQAARA